MRRLRKGPPPAGLLEYAKNPAESPSYAGFRGKPAIQRALLRDQGEVCCYCMQRIDEASMKIEHLEAQDGTLRDLEWPNLLGACRGGEGAPPNQQHCDTRKGSRSLTLHPLSHHAERVHYLLDGTVRAGDQSMQGDLDDVLNLNVARLVRARAAALTDLKRALELKLGRAGWTTSDIETELSCLRSERTSRPFVGFLEFWLDRVRRKR